MHCVCVWGGGVYDRRWVNVLAGSLTLWQLLITADMLCQERYGPGMDPLYMAPHPCRCWLAWAAAGGGSAEAVLRRRQRRVAPAAAESSSDSEAAPPQDAEAGGDVSSTAGSAGVCRLGGRKEADPGVRRGVLHPHTANCP